MTADVRYLWHEAPVPPGLRVTQVYGWLLCPVTARVLLLENAGVFNLPGGTPEAGDHGVLDDPRVGGSCGRPGIRRQPARQAPLGPAR